MLTHRILVLTGRILRPPVAKLILPAYRPRSCSTRLNEVGVSDADVRSALAALIAEVHAVETSGALSSGQAGALRNHVRSMHAARMAGAAYFGPSIGHSQCPRLPS